MNYIFRSTSGSKHSRKRVLRKVPEAMEVFCISVSIELYGN
jgi:hypothetical protein